jgi:septum formation protein
MPTINHFTLGSSSVFRQRVLQQAGYSFDIMTADIDEAQIQREDPAELALCLAQAKARAIIASGKLASGLLLTADQVVVCAGKIRGKPKDEVEARSFLESYNEYAAQTVSALCLIDIPSFKCVSGVDSASIKLAGLTGLVIDNIILDGTIFNCAGGFAVEHPLMSPYVVEVCGTEDSVMGMPLQLLECLLDQIKSLLKDVECSL